MRHRIDGFQGEQDFQKNSTEDEVGGEEAMTYKVLVLHIFSFAARAFVFESMASRQIPNYLKAKQSYRNEAIVM